MDKYKFDISIIIPVYNNEQYIDDCMHSIMKQTFNLNRIQVIMINDGSKDQSLTIMNKYKSKNVLIIDKANTGVSDTRNVGMEKAEGKYILFLDSDDTLSENACKELFNFFEKHYEEIDVVTYPIVYNINGKFKDHTRYKNLYTAGTGIYDLNKDYNLIQTTINIFIKNQFKDNLMFETKQNFSEDERFATELVMRKKRIGYCKEAIYYYRRHHEAATHTIINAYYSFETITSYYENLFQKYEENGVVPRYIQFLYLNNIRWRLKQDALYPYHYEKKDYERAIKRIKKLLQKVDVETVLLVPCSKFHKFYILKLKNEIFSLEIDKGRNYKILCNENIVDEDSAIKSIVNRFKIKDHQIVLHGNLQTLIFELEAPKIYFTGMNRNNEKITKEVATYITNHSYYECNTKTNTIYGYKLAIDLDSMKEFTLYAKIHNQIIPIYFGFNRFSSRKIYQSNIRVAYSNKKFVVTKNSIYFKIKDAIKNIYTYILKDNKILLYRFLAKIYIKKQKIWLYTDKNEVLDNAYMQFKHDILKKDHVKRYYIYNEPFDNIKDNFSKAEFKNLIKFGSLKHKILFLRCDKILSSFVDLQAYCPFETKIKPYTDMMQYEFIYLQYGILHAHLIKKYAKEFTQIDKFVISSDFEKQNLISKYNYDKDDFIKSGMPRMGLDPISKESKKNKILYAPSWRQYLIGNLNNKKILKKNVFLQSNYFKEIYNFLHSKKLQEFLNHEGYQLDFRLHPVFKDYADLFELKNIKNIHINYNKIFLREYKIFITDFSSLQFDFAQLKIPILYFVPDMVEFKAGLHLYRELDLKYEDAFGKLCLNHFDLLQELKRVDKNQCKVDNKYLNRMNKFFFNIQNPCDKIYDVLIKEK